MGDLLAGQIAAGLEAVLQRSTLIQVMDESRDETVAGTQRVHHMVGDDRRGMQDLPGVGVQGTRSLNQGIGCARFSYTHISPEQCFCHGH